MLQIQNYLSLLLFISAAGEIEFSSYYSRAASSSEALHCTAFFSNHGCTKSSSAYLSQDVVEHSLGKSFKLCVVGFVITPRTAGARIALTPRQARLWDKDVFEGNKNRPDGFTIVTDSPKYSRRRAKGNVQATQATGIPKAAPRSSKSKAKQVKPGISNPLAVLAGSDSEDTSTNDSEDNEDAEAATGTLSYSDAGNHSPDDQDYEEMLAFKMGYVQLNERPRFMPTCGLGSRAHVTLGYSKGTNAVQTGLDQVKIIEIEEGYHNNTATKRARPLELDDAAVIHYGDGQCVVYLNNPIDVASLFSARY